LGDRQVEVRIGVGGICGSDLHYYKDGGFGAVRLKQPMVLGHEVAGTVSAIGASVKGIAVGDLVAVNPSRPCGTCDFCQGGMQNHCRDMLFYGSAMRVPHVDGAFRQILIADAGQCHVMPSTCSVAAAAMAEPFSVALHAVSRAGPLMGRNVLVAGSGPIGALVVLAARLHGAREIVATDLVDAPLATAAAVGADRTINVAHDPAAMRDYANDKGYFDIVFEASGNQAAMASALAALKPRGTLVQIGLAGSASLPIDRIVAREIALRGSFRFVEEFALAVALIGSGRADVAPIISHTLPLTGFREAFDLASDRRRAMKVQIQF
jgi:L-idonate 5-dehydrogenase